MIKHFFIFLTTICFLFYSFIFVSYILVRTICKIQIANYISKNNEKIADFDLCYFYLEDISKKIKWEEEYKEFILDSQLYDIIKIKKVNGKTLLVCINDKKETNVLNAFLMYNKKFIIDYLNFLSNHLYLPSKTKVKIFNNLVHKFFDIISVNYKFIKIAEYFRPPEFFS